MRSTSVLGSLILALGLWPAPAAGAGEAAPAAKGTAFITRDAGRVFRSLALAVQLAQDGDTIRVAGGRFEEGEGIEVRGKRLRIEGAGAGQTVVAAPATVLRVADDARVHVSGVGFVSAGGGAFAPAVLLLGVGSTLDGCELTGAAGFGIELRGAGIDTEVYGNTIRGNRGGGVRLTDSLARIDANLVVDNGGPAILLEGRPPAEAVALVEHNTFARNEVQSVAVCVAVPGTLDAAIPPEMSERMVFRYNVASGRLPAGLLTKASLADLGALNVLVPPDDVEDFFVDVSTGDYRPEGPQPTDLDGIEAGARFSESGARQLPTAIADATTIGRLDRALALARRADGPDRKRHHDEIRSSLYRAYVEHVGAKRFGLAVLDFVRVMPRAPFDWTLDDRLRQVVGRIVPAYAVGYDWTSLFQHDSELSLVARELVAKGELRPSRQDAGAADGHKWRVVLRRLKALLTERESDPFTRKVSLENPEFGDISRTLDIEKKRRERAEADRAEVAEDVAMLEARQEGAPSVYLRAKIREHERLAARIAEHERRIATLEEAKGRVADTFGFEVTGTTERATARAAVEVEVTDPTGAVQTETIEYAFEERHVSLQPLAAVEFPGVPPRPADATADQQRHARLLVSAALARVALLVERRDIDRITALVAAELAGKAVATDRNELFELLVVYAPRLDQAVAAEAERLAAEARRETLPTLEEPRVTLVHDRALRRQPPLKLDIELGEERQGVERQVAALEERYAPYWRLLPDLRAAFDRKVGVTLESFLSNALTARAATRP